MRLLRSRPVADSGRISAAALTVAGVLLAALVVSGLVPALSRNREPANQIQGAQVRRGPLRIAVTANGSLNAADTVRLTSGIEGRTTILTLVPEGTQVHEGDLVCELDATAMVEKRIQQSITAGRAEADLVKAKQSREIQVSQNRSDVNKARQALDFADQDLQLFLEGERDFELQQARQAIDLAKEEAQRARGRLGWSAKLADKGFLTSTELEADSIAAHRADVMLEQAERELELLERFRQPRRESELRALLEEARQESERVDLQAQARLVDFDSDLRASEATLALEREKLARLDSQIEKARLRAPRDGYVVYAQRDTDEPPISEGAEVREREEIVSIPGSEAMVVTCKLHESVLKQVHVGQECSVKVDALQGAHFDGRVRFVAMLPDQSSRWSNPNMRLYKSEVAIEGSSAGLRPGMSCSVEILVEELADALYVPVQAVFRDGTRNVAFLAGENRARQQEVRIGRFNELWVQVLSGLSEGDTVLLHAPQAFDLAPIVPEAVKSE